MPDKDKLNLIVGQDRGDLSKVRLEGLEKPFEELTISELVQLRAGSEVADSYNVNAVTDNVSVSSSAMLAELGQIQGVRAMQSVVDQARLDGIRSEVVPGVRDVGAIRPSSAEPPAGEVRLGPSDKAFDADSRNPFDA